MAVAPVIMTATIEGSSRSEKQRLRLAARKTFPKYKRREPRYISADFDIPGITQPWVASEEVQTQNVDMDDSNDERDDETIQLDDASEYFAMNVLPVKSSLQDLRPPTPPSPASIMAEINTLGFGFHGFFGKEQDSEFLQGGTVHDVRDESSDEPNVIILARAKDPEIHDEVSHTHVEIPEERVLGTHSTAGPSNIHQKRTSKASQQEQGVKILEFSSAAEIPEEVAQGTQMPITADVQVTHTYSPVEPSIVEGAMDGLDTDLRTELRQELQHMEIVEEEITGRNSTTHATAQRKRKRRDECAGLRGVADIPVKRARVLTEKGRAYMGGNGHGRRREASYMNRRK